MKKKNKIKNPNEVYNYFRDKIQAHKNKKKYKEEKADMLKSANMTKEESSLVNEIECMQTVAEEPLQTFDLLDRWEDNKKMYDGNHWDISAISRTQDEKKHRFNMVKNHVRGTINNMRDSAVLTVPETKVDALEEEPIQNQQMMQQITPVQPEMTRTKLADMITCMLKHNDNVDCFQGKWRRNLLFFFMHGPLQAEIIWDNNFIGGSGPERWQGDIRTNFIDKEDFFPDPAIIDLENDLQSCDFVNLKLWKKLSYISQTWKKGKYVIHDFHEDDYKETGSAPTSAYLIKHRHRGKPYFMPAKRKKELLELADIFKAEGDHYRHLQYKAYANMEIDGIHCCYTAGNVLLEYIPYEYEHGEYPVIFTTRFLDEDNPRGDGEITDLIMPNMAIDKAEESMLSALAKQGLGNIFTTPEGMDTNQERNYIMRNGRGGAVHRVNDINEFREQQPGQIPPIFLNYIQTQEMFMEKSSSVTAIQKGISPGSNVPLGTIQELGARTDMKTRAVNQILSDFYKKREKFRIKLMAQFYTEDRYYRIKGEGNKIKSGKLNRKDMMFQWDRTDEEGIVYKEWFVPDFDLKIRVIDERPMDRNANVNKGLAYLQQGLLTKELMWDVDEDGKLPNKEIAVEMMRKQDEAMAQAGQAQLDHEVKLKELEYEYKLKIEEMKERNKQQEIGVKQQEADRKDVEVAYNQSNEEKKLSLEQQKLLGELSKEDNPDKLLQFLQQSFPNTYNLIKDKRLPEQARQEIIQKIINTPENELEELLLSMENMVNQLINEGG